MILYKKYTKIILLLTSAAILSLSGCGHDSTPNDSVPEYTDTADNSNITSEPDNTFEPDTPSPEPFSYINNSGKTLEERFNTPADYTRTEEKEGSFASYLRNYQLKKDGSPVLLYNGEQKSNQSAHTAVFKLPIENEDLQQCADSVMRMYGEYYYSLKQYDKINYPLGGGFKAAFSKWSQGFGIKLNGDKLSWATNHDNNSSYNSFKKFMRIVFAYSGTINLSDDSSKISIKQAAIGDIFIKGGSPGHVVMIVDMCRNSKGKIAFLLGQGYMPAQEFHVIKNPLHDDDPWYYEDEISYPLNTPEYTFGKGSLRHPHIAD